MVATNVTLEVEGLSGTTLYQHAERLERLRQDYTLEGDESYSELEQKIQKHSWGNRTFGNFNKQRGKYLEKRNGESCWFYNRQRKGFDGTVKFLWL